MKENHSVLFVILSYRCLPLLESDDILPCLAVYDAGNSGLVAMLDDEPAFDVFEAVSQEQMVRYLGMKDYVVVGLVVPADWSQQVAADGPLRLDGYVVHWASATAAAEQRDWFEQQLGVLLDRTVEINLEGHTVYTEEDSRGMAFLAALTLVLAVTMTGVVIVPHILIEEKRSKTLDALLVSPATGGQIVLGKALAGLFYCLTASALVLALNATLVTHWGLAALAVASGALFAISLGLLLGSLLQMPQQLMLWSWVTIPPLLITVFLSTMDDLLPAGLIAVIEWVPTVALARVLRVSFAERAPLAQFTPELAVILGSAAVVLAAVAWVVRRSDR